MSDARIPASALERRSKPLHALLAEAGWGAQSQHLPSALREVAIADLTLDSRRCGPDCGFVALQGQTTHGLRYAAQALESGAAVVLFDSGDATPAQAGDPRLVGLPGLQERWRALAVTLYGDARPSHLVAITGTDGKTTTTHWLAAVLKHCGLHSAVIGTLGSGDPATVRDAVASSATSMTTPDALRLRSLLTQQAAQGFDAAVMEASSHALSQRRLDGFAVDVAVLTHLGHDHLDYHGSVEAYGDAKARLFRKHAATGAWALNVDDRLGRELWDDPTPNRARIGYAGAGPAGGDASSTRADTPQPRRPHDELWHVENLNTRAEGLSAEFVGAVADSRGGWSSLGRWTIEVPVFGAFQIQNVAAVWCAARALSLPAETVVDALRALPGVPGRMEAFGAGRECPTAIVDYAHTEGALRAVLQALDGHVSGRLVCLFGCGGDRDRSKRAAMGAVAARHADVVIVTDDNPRSEPPATIRAEILRGAASVEKPRAERIEDAPGRDAAIRRALVQAGAGDIVLLAGKGHETTQDIAGERLPLSDRALAAQWAAEHSRGHVAREVHA